MGYKWSQLNSTRRSDAVKLFWWNTVCADSCSYRNHCTTLTQSCAKASALAFKRSHFNKMSHCSRQIGTMISYIICYKLSLFACLALRSFQIHPPGTPHIGFNPRNEASTVVAPFKLTAPRPVVKVLLPVICENGNI